MIKVIEAREQQGYTLKHNCPNCKHVKVYETVGKLIKIEHRCSLGLFRVSVTGVCNQFKKK